MTSPQPTPPPRLWETQIEFVEMQRDYAAKRQALIAATHAAYLAKAKAHADKGETE